MTLLPAGPKSFKIWKGGTFKKRIVLYEDEAGETPRDLTGYAASLDIKDKADGSILFSLSTTNSRITLGGLDGTVDLIISATDTAALTWKSGVYDLLIESPSGEVDPILQGQFVVQSV